MNLKKEKMANSRFVFHQFKDDLNFWQAVLGKIDNFIKDHTQFERANPYVYIYFLPENIFWIGREVIGVLPFIGDEDPRILDFKGGEIYSFSLEFDLNFKLNDLLNLKNKICQENVLEIDVSLPWRLRIDLEKEDKIPLEMEFFTANYPFPKLTN